jgi:outer membrane immunogenic protein
MKNLLLATIALCAFAADSAAAADLSLRKSGVVTAAPPCAARQFQGGYVGVSGGSVYHTANRTDAEQFLEDTAAYILKTWGGTVGGQAGYNWTTCQTLWGVEIDGSWVGGAENELVVNLPGFGGLDQVVSRMDALATARVRTGLVFDNILLYVTGGIAGARFHTTWQATSGADVFTADIREWRWGWTAGFGTEWAWTPNMSLKSEVLYADFVDRDHDFALPVGPGFQVFRHSDSVWVARIGLNYRWGGPVGVR